MSFALAIAPLLILLAALLCGRYPAETVIRRLAGERPRWRPEGDHDLPQPHRGFPPRLMPRGSQLIARALAGRAPPGRRAATTT